MASDRGPAPTVMLDVDEISHNMAARLTIALLGQMLYMKGQVPFPISSLGRLSERRTDDNTSRAALRMMKKRTDFLQAFDDLTSHLHTTFVALSTALALNEDRHPLVPCTLSSSAMQPCPSVRARRRPAKVHVLLILGPSPSAAKTRVVLELDGLRVERFGERDYLCHDEEEEESDEDRDDEQFVDGAAEATTHTPVGSPPQSPSRPHPPRMSCEPYTPFTPPAVHCHASHGSVPSSPEPSDLESSLSPSTDTSFSEDDFTDSVSRRLQETNQLALAQRTEEAALRAGERLLSRALFAGGEGLGFGDEIQPTQAHILIRAPRRLAHPTWVPRQSLGGVLDRQVRRFLDDELCAEGKTGVGRAQRKGAFGVGLRTVGVRVQCREVRGREEDNADCEWDGDAHDEEDENEMIWWSWDGKLLGFAD